MLGELMR
ncbi:hypothetical protein E2C01_098357 [Portunus trituberculatus]|nr:hypothetical protein [Portunus trituberculatus]